MTDHHEHEYEIWVPSEGLREKVRCVRLAPDVFRVSSIPVAVESLSFSDEFKAEELAPGKLRFITMVRAGLWRKSVYILADSARGSQRLRAVLDRITEHGGISAIVFGGLLAVCMPPHSEYDPGLDVAAL